MSDAYDYQVSLDHNGLLQAGFTITHGTLNVSIFSSESSRDLLSHLVEKKITLNHGDTKTPFVMGQGDHDTLKASTELHHNTLFSISLHHHAIIGAKVNTKGIFKPMGFANNRLSVFETRMLGISAHPHVPYARIQPKKYDQELHFTTDLHTHITSQITASDLLKAAAKIKALYPVELLDMLGVDTSIFVHEDMESFEFYPTIAEGLTCEQPNKTVKGIRVSTLLKNAEATQTLTQALSIPSTRIYTFDEIERFVYRMRNPLTKNPAVVPGMIMAIAKDYQQQGTRYAELSATGVCKADWLKRAIPALEKAEQEYNVALRLLAGIPRSLPPGRMLKTLERIKFAAQSPFVVGIDFLGYESNKTRNFDWALHHISRWAHDQKEGTDTASNNWNFEDDFIIRVHAGENGKNPANVKEVLDVAMSYQVRTRIGHAAHGDISNDIQLATKLAKKGLLMVEFNPDSNMALNSIDCIDDLPISAWMNAKIPCVIGSDGAGAYQTTSAQLALCACFSGLGLKELETIEHIESHYISFQQQLFKAKHTAFNHKYPRLTDFIRDFRRKEKFIENHGIEKRKPLFIAGASGESWHQISATVRKQVEIGMHMLTKALNPNNCYFVLGRVKEAGIGQALDRAVLTHNKHSTSQDQLSVVGLLAHNHTMPTIALSLSHIIELDDAMMSIPTHMIHFIKENKGHALFIGGKAFTRDFIHLSHHNQVPFGIMKGAKGASDDKSRLASEQLIFKDAKSLLRQLYCQKHGRHLFKREFNANDANQLETLYQECLNYVD